MTRHGAASRPGARSLLMIVSSIAASIGISVAMDAAGLRLITFAPGQIIVAAALFNATSVLQSVVGGIIEWRRPGHTIGRLLMLSGPAYAFVSAGWTTLGTLQSLVDPQLYRVASWAVFMLSYPVVALMAGWIPLLFPTGTLPSRGWRLPIASLIVLSSIGLAAMAVRPGPLAAETGLLNPLGIDGWPTVLQTFVDAIPVELSGLLALGAVALITRYRRGDRVERLQIRWLVSAVSVCMVGLVLTVAAYVVGSESPPIAQSATLVAYAGILLMPIAIGIAVLRYRLYEIDRIISRTIGWAVVTGVLVAIFAGLVVGLQAILASFTQGQTLAVAASTLIAFVLFQPVRRRVQSVVDRRFNRARYDAEGTAAAFAERQRDQMDIAGLTVDLTGTINSALHPRAIGVWIRGSGSGGTP